ncbi:hypothetical protein ERO13_D08G015132v2 [Gossypium hirsutum]|uniref:Uncharacterized protein n=2 Tax=Gossypium TaxID=3633 RepID=A0A5J5QEE1_GOSBA|nr:hypothetical protein ES319_D08G009100v1 [Gossypium barbadense]KAG4132157.1 hypothetical protein ERO13_D08G015132v2 [Gossypium hirsutum]TYI67318.1 hypothetical protein E1A91_D08G009400v1 [Gossypium mustelinum]
MIQFSSMFLKDNLTNKQSITLTINKEKKQTDNLIGKLCLLVQGQNMKQRSLTIVLVFVFYMFLFEYLIGNYR